MRPLIQAVNLAKRYRKGTGATNLRSLLSDWTNEDKYDYHWAVRDVSFAVHPGEALGIIGPNGACKTTILKLLSRVTKPSSGDLRVNGRLSALIELGAGFHPDLSGRENIYLNGTLLGMSRQEIGNRFDEIVDFSGIGSFLDTPVKRYSSGMYARLGFAIAAHVDPEILLVDEVLAVGDYAFQQKCHARMDELRANGTSLIFVSHNLDAVQRVCDRAMVMYQGRAIFDGSAAAAVVAYSDALRDAARAREQAVPVSGGLSQRVMTFEAEIERVVMVNAEGAPTTVVPSGSRVRVLADVRFHEAVSQPIFALNVLTRDGVVVYAATTRWLGICTPDFAAGERCRVAFDLDVPLLNGSYEVGVNVGAADLTHYYDRVERALTFRVVHEGEVNGIVDMQARIDITATSPEPAPE